MTEYKPLSDEQLADLKRQTHRRNLSKQHLIEQARRANAVSKALEAFFAPGPDGIVRVPVPGGYEVLRAWKAYLGDPPA